MKNIFSIRVLHERFLRSTRLIMQNEVYFSAKCMAFNALLEGLYYLFIVILFYWLFSSIDKTVKFKALNRQFPRDCFQDGLIAESFLLIDYMYILIIFSLLFHDIQYAYAKYLCLLTHTESDQTAIIQESDIVFRRSRFCFLFLKEL